MTELKSGWFDVYKLRNLRVHVLLPKYLVLVKIEAASSVGGKHFEDALRLVRDLKIQVEDIVEVYREYRPEIEMIPRMTAEFNIFVREAYGDQDFDIKNFLG